MNLNKFLAGGPDKLSSFLFFFFWVIFWPPASIGFGGKLFSGLISLGHLFRFRCWGKYLFFWFISQNIFLLYLAE